MTTYVPRLNQPIVAARLKEDLLVPRGDWVIIDPATDTVTQLSHETFMVIYGAAAKRASDSRNQAAPRLLGIKGPSSNKENSRGGRSADAVLTTQGGRFFYHLRRVGHPITTAELGELLTPPDTAKSASAALSVMTELGLTRKITQKRDGKHGMAPALWGVTDKGCVVFDRLGPVCFTRYNMQVPPDHLEGDLAAKLAAAWADRHSP